MPTAEGIGASRMTKSPALTAACAVLGCNSAALEQVLIQRGIATGIERVVKPLKVRPNHHHHHHATYTTHRMIAPLLE